MAETNQDAGKYQRAQSSLSHVRHAITLFLHPERAFHQTVQRQWFGNFWLIGSTSITRTASSTCFRFPVYVDNRKCQKEPDQGQALTPR